MQPLVGIESSHLSQQLAVLRRAGLVTTRKEGASVVYAIADPLIAELLAVAKQLLIASLSHTQDLLTDLRAASGE
jgi:ArsR family transcriptional regulator